MPMELFNKLSTDKKEKILNAAVKEFTLESYENASINKIIKDADIARGSFYLYFHDKLDLYLYLLDIYLEKIMEPVTIIMKGKENYFDKIVAVFDKILERNQESQLFIKILSNMNYSQHEMVVMHIHGKMGKFKGIDDLNIEKQNVVKELSSQCLVFALFGAVVMKNEVEEEREKLKYKLNIIRRGMVEC